MGCEVKFFRGAGRLWEIFVASKIPPKKDTLSFFRPLLHQETSPETTNGSYLGNILRRKPMLRMMKERD